ncbi:MAG TPA: hypothetical protein VME92_13410 [Acetobacteraceae bacterium]|nr:hypothetical protein [Acetobacteraceae bacterium]
MRSRPIRQGIVRGMLLLARGRAVGLAEFGETPEAFLASLAPLIAFPLVFGVLLLLNGGGWQAVGDFLAALCALLAPPVLSQLLARLWRRETLWLRYATAFNWCQWVLPVVAGLALLGVPVLAALGADTVTAARAAVLVICGYGLWLHWFLARRGLNLSGLRAALLVIAVNLGTGVLVFGPQLIALATKEGIAR